MKKPKYNRPLADQHGLTDYSEEDKRFVLTWIKYILYKLSPVFIFIVLMTSLYLVAEAQINNQAKQLTLSDVKTAQNEDLERIEGVAIPIPHSFSCNGENMIYSHFTGMCIFDLPEPSGVFDLGVDLEALSKAVARHETNHCKSGGNFAEVNNCHGIRVYNGERLVPAKFPGYINGQRFNNSYEAFIDLWKRKYGGLPDWEKARLYSGNDRTEFWLANTLAFYGEYTKVSLNF